MSPPNKHPAFFSSPTPGTSSALHSMNLNRTLLGDRRDGSSSSSDDRLHSILAGMRAISHPNDEPRRSVLEILDDAIALEDDYQRQQRGAPRRRDPREDGGDGKTTKQ